MAGKKAIRKCTNCGTRMIEVPDRYICPKCEAILPK